MIDKSRQVRLGAERSRLLQQIKAIRRSIEARDSGRGSPIEVRTLRKLAAKIERLDETLAKGS